MVCPDCGGLMISQGTEQFKRKVWIILERVDCGSSVREKSAILTRWLRKNEWGSIVGKCETST